MEGPRRRCLDIMRALQLQEAAHLLVEMVVGMAELVLLCMDSVVALVGPVLSAVLKDLARLPMSITLSVYEFVVARTCGLAITVR